MSAPHGPLQGVKVVSCSTAQAGTVPWMLMADLGADVIKIETPDGGDSSRRMTVPPGMQQLAGAWHREPIGASRQFRTLCNYSDPAQAGGHDTGARWVSRF